MIRAGLVVFSELCIKVLTVCVVLITTCHLPEHRACSGPTRLHARSLAPVVVRYGSLLVTT